MNWDAIKQLASSWGRPLLSKWIQRAILWGATAISAKFAVAAPDGDTVSKVTEWCVTIALAIAAAGIDYIHDRADKKAAK